MVTSTLQTIPLNLSLKEIFHILALIRVNFQSVWGPITITDVWISTKYDAQEKPSPPVNVIRPDQSRIYCFVTISAPKAVSVGVRWYWDGKIIYEDQGLVQTRRAFYIEPLPGKTLPEGDYQVEILLANQVIRKVNFSVIQ